MFPSHDINKFKKQDKTLLNCSGAAESGIYRIFFFFSEKSKHKNCCPIPLGKLNYKT